MMDLLFHVQIGGIFETLCGRNRLGENRTYLSFCSRFALLQKRCLRFRMTLIPVPRCGERVLPRRRRRGSVLLASERVGQAESCKRRSSGESLVEVEETAPWEAESE